MRYDSHSAKKPKAGSNKKSTSASKPYTTQQHSATNMRGALFGSHQSDLSKGPERKPGKIKKTSFIKQKQELSKDDKANDSSYLRQAVGTPHHSNVDEGAAVHSMS